MKTKATYKILALMLMMILSAPVYAFVPFLDADTSFYNKYPYIYFVGKGDSTAISEDYFFDHAGYVIFPVGKTKLPLNSPLLKELSGTVLPQMNRDGLQLKGVILRGSASPDGSWKYNKYLGQARAKSLLNFLKSQTTYPISDSLMAAKSEAEDYRLLCRQMMLKGDPDYSLVAILCDKYLGIGRQDILKQKLMRIRGGRLWRRLYKEYFPGLRSARLMLTVKKFEPEPKPVVEPVVPPVVIAPAETEKVAPTVPDTVYEEYRISRRELLSIKTNLLFYGAYVPFGYNRYCPIPNIAIEYYPLHGHFTLGASLDFPWWVNYEKHKFFEVRNLQIEGRYYFKTNESNGSNETNGTYKGPAFKGFYLQAYGHVGIFEIGLNVDRGYKGEGFGGGLGLGYVMPISKKGHWRLEFAAQFGYLYVMHDPFQYEYRGIELHDGLYYYDWVRPASEFKKRQYRYTYFGPTRVGVTLTYDLLYRTNAKTKKKLDFKRVSFRSYEAKKSYKTNRSNETNLERRSGK